MDAQTNGFPQGLFYSMIGRKSLSHHVKCTTSTEWPQGKTCYKKNCVLIIAVQFRDNTSKQNIWTRHLHSRILQVHLHDAQRSDCRRRCSARLQVWPLLSPSPSQPATVGWLTSDFITQNLKICAWSPLVTFLKWEASSILEKLW